MGACSQEEEVMSSETLRRVKRTLLQALASGAFTSVGVAALGGGQKEIIIAFVGAMGVVASTWFQNVLEDSERIRDRRA